MINAAAADAVLETVSPVIKLAYLFRITLWHQILVTGASVLASIAKKGITTFPFVFDSLESWHLCFK